MRPGATTIEMTNTEEHRRDMRRLADELEQRERERSDALLAAIAALRQNQHRIEALVVMIARDMGLKLGADGSIM